jgi:hypothetical protein
VQTETLQVALCAHNLGCPFSDHGSVLPVGNDASPQAIAQAPLYSIMKDVSHEIIGTGGSKPNLYLWNTSSDALYDPMIDPVYSLPTPDSVEESSWWFSDDGKPFQSQSFWASSLPNGTTTGILRQHAMRLNSSVKCELMPEADYPTRCEGGRPFNNSWVNTSGDTDILTSVCVPGNYSQTPWTHSRDRQDIREEMYLKALAYVKHDPVQVFYDGPLYLHCVAITSRDYFELGNYFNKNIPQPLLETWPTPDVMEENFVDYEESTDPYDYNLYLLNAT